MARSNSPGYPNFPLPKAISMVRAIYSQDRRNIIDREVAAKHVGYNGLNGASEKALGSLAHYGLVEKAGKGQLRVSQIAVDILHPESPEGRNSALQQAAFGPAVFADIRERFTDGLPSEDALKSWMMREEFLDRAINPVTKAYLETCRYLEQENAMESVRPSDVDDPESHSPDTDDEHSDPFLSGATPQESPAMDQQASQQIKQTAPLPSATENDIKIMLDGDFLRVSAVIDASGAKKLMKALKANIALLDDDDDDA